VGGVDDSGESKMIGQKRTCQGCRVLYDSTFPAFICDLGYPIEIKEGVRPLVPCPKPKSNLEAINVKEVQGVDNTGKEGVR